MYLYNSATRKRELFVPNNPGIVKMYTCGPTVYHFAHIGNLRSYIMEDVLEKALRYEGYHVKRVMNITDVGHLASDADTGEDKMLKGAKRENKSVMEIAKYYTDAFFADCKDLNIKTPDVVEPATNCITEYIHLVERLLEKGSAYIAGGNVYFDTSTLEKYYIFNEHDEEDLAVGVREGVEEEIPTVESATRLSVGAALDATYVETSTTLDANQNWYDAATGQPLNDDSMESLLEAAESVTWSELLTASATEDELTEWSLTDETATTVTVYEGDAATLSLLLGATNDDGDYYARLSGSTMVYTVSADDVGLLVSANADAMLVTELYPVAFDSIAEAAFTLDGQSYAFQRTETEETVEAHTDEETGEEVEATTETKVTVTLNGEETDAEAAGDLWYIVTGLSLTGEAEASAEGEPLLAISATSESGVTASVQFYACDADSYIAVTDDGRTMLTDAAAIDKLIRNVRQLG